MIIWQKNLANTIVLIMCMLFCCASYFEQKNTSSLIELNTENNSILECVDSDLDLNEEIQIFVALNYSIMVEKQVQHNHFHFDNRLVQQFYPVWQPPKLS